MVLNRRSKYLQIAFNRTILEVERMINLLPPVDKILIEAGTPFVKNYGQDGIGRLAFLWRQKVGPQGYIVADLKCMDRGFTEVETAARAGASAATCLGLAPIETVNDFIKNCQELKIDSMIDMMNVEFPFEVLQQLKKMPDIVVLHRGVDEGTNKEKVIPYYNINRIRGAYNVMISVAGGEGFKDVQRAFFNGADISVIWKTFFEDPYNTNILAEQFLVSIKSYAKQ
jgi:bifunctional enzyme Fae/Hps